MIARFFGSPSCPLTHTHFFVRHTQKHVFYWSHENHIFCNTHTSVLSLDQIGQLSFIPIVLIKFFVRFVE